MRGKRHTIDALVFKIVPNLLCSQDVAFVVSEVETSSTEVKAQVEKTIDRDQAEIISIRAASRQSPLPNPSDIYSQCFLNKCVVMGGIYISLLFFFVMLAKAS